MLILAIDTSLETAAACVFDSETGAVVSEYKVRLARGHDAVLLNVVQSAMARVAGGFGALDRIAVAAGPGSFTGLRIGVAAARAFGLVTGAPVVGVSTLAAFAAPSLGQKPSKTIISTIDARHGRVFAQAFDAEGRVVLPAQQLSVVDALNKTGAGSVRLVGSGAPLLAIEAWRQGRSAEVEGDLIAPPIEYVARLGALADPALAAPRPIYIKPAATTLSAAQSLAVSPRTAAP